MKKFLKSGVIMLVAVMVFNAMGCSKNTAQKVNGSNGEIPKTISIFSSIGGNAVKGGANNHNDLLPYQMMEELTGCHVEWIHPSGSSEENFSLLIASGNLPDMIVYKWRSINGGSRLYIDDEIIIPLANIIEEHMPNLDAFNKQRPEIKKQYTQDDGEVHFIPFIRKDAELKVFLGPQIREDWLQNLNLSVPKTTDELYEVLKAFKTGDPNRNNKADEIPMSGVSFHDSFNGIGNLIWAFGTHYDFYVKDNTVKYGIMEDRFEEAIQYVAKLHKEELIDIDYILNNREKMDAKMMNDRIGFLYSFQPSKYYYSMNDGTRKVTGIQHLTGPYGDNDCYASDYANDTIDTSIAFTTANENPVGSAKWLDNFFGGKGLEYMNFGKEDLTFTWDNGYPKLTDYILRNPDGIDTNIMSGMNLGAYESAFPTLQDWRYYEQILSEWGKDAVITWTNNVNIDGILPPLSFTEEETRKITQSMSQIKTYTEEIVNKIILGQESVDSLPAVRQNVKNMGIEEVLSIYNHAYTRYNNR